MPITWDSVHTYRVVREKINILFNSADKFWKCEYSRQIKILLSDQIRRNEIYISYLLFVSSLGYSVNFKQFPFLFS